jgi:N-acyl-D-amino-acid deacylase
LKASAGQLWFVGLVLALPGIAPAEDSIVPLTGRERPELVELDRLMTRFMKEQRPPGMALAVSRHGRLVYARGTGYADVKSRRLVQPESLFRIASVSKPLTAVAVLRLVERGKLHLSDPVFDLLHYDPLPGQGDKVDPRLKRITIEHLLHHTGGWDRDRSFDPMFRSLAIARACDHPPPASARDIIRYMLTQPLDFDPGSAHAYSNFGYCLLGRVIEKASGLPYETSVRREVLAPLGIRHMRLGRTVREGQAAGEVVYYDEKDRKGPAVVGSLFGEQVPLPYGAWCLEAMDAHGGWIASAVDLVRFASAFDDPATCKLLRPETIRAMLARPPGKPGLEKDGKPRAVYYACGWQVRQLDGDRRCNIWHNGALDGTASILIRRADGVCLAVLFNARNGAGGEYLASAIEGPLHKAIDAVKAWPAGEPLDDDP